MKLGETEPSARRIGPMRAVDENGDPVTDFSAPGAVEISFNDGPFAAATGDIEVIGDGFVYYQATAPDASVQGFAVVKLAVVCEETTLREEIEPAPQGIPVNTEDEDLLHLGPLRVVDENGDPLTDLTGVDFEISINGAAWDAPAGDLTLIDDGYADYAPDPTEAEAIGWIAVRLSGACQEVVFRSTVVAPSSGDAPTITVVSPTPDADPGEVGGLSTSWAVAHVTPIVIDIDGEDLDYASVVARYPTDVGILERVVYRRGAFRAGFTIGSSSEQVTASKLRLTILPDSSWPSSLSASELELDVDAAGGSELSVLASFSFVFPDDPAITPVEVPVEHADIPEIDPVELALSRLPRQYRFDDGIPLELLT